MLTTARLCLHPASDAELEHLIADQRDETLRQAYREMLAGCRTHPGERDWYAPWLIDAPGGRNVGQLCFRGISPEGVTEIGYGIETGQRGKGYATEALGALAAWAFRNPALKTIEAETDPGNAASMRVLGKCGFAPTGETGGEGPRFALKRERI